MALSPEEQRLLEQMEAALAADDPKWAHKLRGTGSRRVHRRRAALAGIGFFVGLALLVAGIGTYFWISIIGFVVMVAAAVTAITSWQHVGDADPGEDPQHDRPKASHPSPGSNDNQNFMGKMEERWRRRRDEGL